VSAVDRGALDFLSPSRARLDLGFSPLLKSSLERAQRDAGAHFEERSGWLVPVSFPGEAERLASVGIADLSHLAKFEVRGPSVPLEGGEGAVWHRIAPRRALALCPYAQSDWLCDRLERAFPFVLDQTAAYAILAVVGQAAATLMRRLTHLHTFPASGDVAHVGSHVLEQDGGYWIVFPQEFGHYLWEVAVDAAVPLGGGPVGVAAIERGTS
jgi:glycine cleavage system aminomethyltransferase T